MLILKVGLALFALPHFFSLLMPAVRDGVKQRFGDAPYKGLYSLLSVIGLGLIVYGYHIVSNEPAAVVYEPNAGMKHLTMTLALIAFILIGASHGKGYIKRWVRQPMSWGIALWSLGHLLVNGRDYDLWLFGTFLVVSLIDIVLSEMRGKIPTHTPVIRSDIIAVVVGLVLYAIVIFWFHPSVIGLPILA